MSDVVAVALITSFATLGGSVGVTYLNHRLQIMRDRRDARRNRIFQAREPVAAFVTASERFLLDVRNVAETRLDLARQKPIDYELRSPDALVPARDRLNEAFADLLTLIDDTECIERLHAFGRLRTEVQLMATTQPDDAEAVERLTFAAENASRAHSLAIEVHERVTHLIQNV